MAGRRKDMVELRLRLPGEGWKELAALLTALLAGGNGGMIRGNKSTVQGEAFTEWGVNEEGGFSAAFLRSAQREAEMAASRAKESPGIEAGGSPGETSHLQSESGDRQPAGEETASAERRSAAERTMERGGIAASAAVPYGLTYRGEGAVTALSGGAAGVSGSGESSGGEKGAAEDWSRRWERDCRRYDGGFPTA